MVASSETITSAVIAMSKSLEVQVVAEGVETQQQLEFLERQGGCQLQGFFFARPMAAAQMDRYLGEHGREPRRAVDAAADGPEAIPPTDDGGAAFRSSPPPPAA